MGMPIQVTDAEGSSSWVDSDTGEPVAGPPTVNPFAQADTVGGRVKLSDLASIGITADHLAATGFRDNGDGTATRMALLEDPTANQQNSSGLTGMINATLGNPLLYAGIAGAGALGAFGSASAFGADAALAAGGAGSAAGGGAALAGGASAADAAGLAQMAADAGLTGQAATNFVASGGTLGSTAGLNTLGSSLGVNPRDGLANPFTSPEIPEIYQGSNPVAGSTPTGGFNMDYFKNTPTSSLTGKLTDLGIDPARAAQFAQSLSGAGSGVSALSNLFSGQGGANDYAKLLGAGVDIFGANAARNRSNQLWDAGSDARARFNAGMQPGFDINNIPGYKSALDTSTNAYLSKISAAGGNPAGTGSAQAETQKYLMGSLGLPTWQNYESQNANVGFGQGVTEAGTSGIKGLASAVGQGTGRLTAEPYDMNSTLGNLSSLSELFKKFGGGGDMFTTQR